MESKLTLKKGSPITPSIPEGTLNSEYCKDKYINNLPNYCFEKYECVNVDNIIDGESNLATNLFFINKNTLLMSGDIKFKNFIQYLKDEGFVVLTIALDNIFGRKGGIRCIIQPLLRQ